MPMWYKNLRRILMFTGRAGLSRIVFFSADCRRMALGVVFCAAVFCARTSVWAGQTTNGAQSNQAQAARPGQEKKDEVARASAKSSAHHFDRVVIIVLENGDYETAIKDKNLAALAAQGASFSNFH